MAMSSKRAFILWVIIFSVIAAAFLAGALFIRKSVAASFDTGRQTQDARVLLFGLLKAQLDEETGVRGYVATRDHAFLQPYNSARRQIPQTAIPLEVTLYRLRLSSAAATIADAEHVNAIWLRSIATPLILHRIHDSNALQRQGKRLVDRFREDASRADQDLVRRNQEVRGEFDTDLTLISVLIAIATLLLIATALAFLVFQKRATDSLERELMQGEEARERARNVQTGYEAEKRTAQTGYEADKRAAQTGYEAEKRTAQTGYEADKRAAQTGYEADKRAAQTGYEADKRAAQTGYEADKRAAEALQEVSSTAQREHAEAQLRHAAYHDALTGLPNRVFFLDRLSNAIMRMKRHPGTLVAILFLDIDRFKIINDSLGHAAGDRLLAALALRLASCLRPYDMLVRLGGDEFTILLEDAADVRDACDVAERILHALVQPFRIDEQDVFATISIGVALGELGSEDAVGMLRDADIAMYRAKQLGGGRYELFVHEMHVQAMARSQLEMDLRRALARNELRLAYQPIVALGTGRIKGFEALARWQHTEQGMIPPSAFIPLAEETGLIVPLGEWVLTEACRQARTWQDVQPGGPPVSVNVNVAAKQLITKAFTTNGLSAQVKRVLAESGLDPAQLNLEITESALLDYAEATEVALAYVRSLGVALQLDDFGTGYSSLSYLQRLPIDTVKIDRSFVSGGPGTGIANPQIVQAIVALARSLGKCVTAEGVETVEQLTELQALRCTYAQGYYLSRPLDEDGARAFLSRWQPFPGFDFLSDSS
jgi:diguanylate cyclase (GGDEF)-like protein